MALMDGTRYKAVLKVVTAIAPWARPRIERWDRQDVIVLDLVAQDRFFLMMAPSGGWMVGRGLAFGGDGDGVMPMGMPEPLGTSRSDGAQTTAGMFLARFSDALATTAQNSNLTDTARDEAKSRWQRLDQMY